MRPSERGASLPRSASPLPVRCPDARSRTTTSRRSDVRRHAAARRAPHLARSRRRPPLGGPDPFAVRRPTGRDRRHERLSRARRRHGHEPLPHLRRGGRAHPGHRRRHHRRRAAVGLRQAPAVDRSGQLRGHPQSAGPRPGRGLCGCRPDRRPHPGRGTAPRRGACAPSRDGPQGGDHPHRRQRDGGGRRARCPARRRERARGRPGGGRGLARGARAHPRAARGARAGRRRRRRRRRTRRAARVSRTRLCRPASSLRCRRLGASLPASSRPAWCCPRRPPEREHRRGGHARVRGDVLPRRLRRHGGGRSAQPPRAAR